MTKLERLRAEAKTVSKLILLPVQMKQMLERFYIREIDAIEQYGADNPKVKIPRKREI